MSDSSALSANQRLKFPCGHFRAVDDDHPSCVRCRGRICSRKSPCSFCTKWSDQAWWSFDVREDKKKRTKLAQARRKAIAIARDVDSEAYQTDSSVAPGPKRPKSVVVKPKRGQTQPPKQKHRTRDATATATVTSASQRGSSERSHSTEKVEKTSRSKHRKHSRDVEIPVCGSKTALAVQCPVAKAPVVLDASQRREKHRTVPAAESRPATLRSPDVPDLEKGGVARQQTHVRPCIGLESLYKSPDDTAGTALEDELVVFTDDTEVEQFLENSTRKRRHSPDKASASQLRKIARHAK